MTDKHLDDAIDRAVREMMSAEPASDLRQRVLDTITRPRRRAIVWSALAYGSAALAAIVLIVVSLVTRRPDVPETRVAGTTTLSPAPAPTTPAPVAPPPAPQPSLSLPGRSPSPPRQARGTSTPSVDVPNVADRRVEAASIPGALALESETGSAAPLEPVVPLGIATIGAEPIATKEIGIRPIEIVRIEIAPLPPRR
jgi:hypothetical protein